MAEGICYVQLRAPQDHVAESDRCGAAPGRALGESPKWHQDLVAGLVSIPEVQPGDTVFWHTDICHAVADRHGGKDYATNGPGSRLHEQSHRSTDWSRRQE
jgi:hypothetical protein